jgi:hypothetical protein
MPRRQVRKLVAPHLNGWPRQFAALRNGQSRLDAS